MRRTTGHLVGLRPSANDHDPNTTGPVQTPIRAKATSRTVAGLIPPQDNAKVAHFVCVHSLLQTNSLLPLSIP